MIAEAELLDLLRDGIGDEPDTITVETEARIAAAVDRAVNQHQADEAAAPPWRALPPKVAVELGWCICVECGRGITPGLAIGRRGAEFHPECIAELLRAAA